MESVDDSNCPSMSDSLSLYERYMRSFNIVDNFVENNNNFKPAEPLSSSTCDYDSSNSGGNIDLSDAVQADVDKHCVGLEEDCGSLQPLSDIDNYANKPHSSSEGVLHSKADSSFASLVGSLETSSATAEHCLLNDKSYPAEADTRVSSEDSKSESFKHSVFITSTMENSNNAVDSVPMFRDIRNNESIFKLPISELSFNGTIKHVQKLKPIVDPLTALSTVNVLTHNTEPVESFASSSAVVKSSLDKYGSQSTSDTSEDKNTCEMGRMDKTTESSGDSQYEREFKNKKECEANEEGSNAKWNLEHSYSSIETSFDSGVRSPDMFSEDDDDPAPPTEPFWNFLKDFEAYDKKKVRKIEETLQGILPPPSVTTLKTDVTEMLKKYYCFLPAFNEDVKINMEANPTTPTKKVSFVHIPNISNECDDFHETSANNSHIQKSVSTKDSNMSDCEINTSANEKTIELKMCTDIEARETLWPDVLKCRFYDVYYNVSSCTEKYEILLQRYRERFVGGETDTSVNIYSGGLQSPSSACKRKALRLKMAQAKSPGRRLSHLARRRQAFCSAATIGEKAHAATAKMVLIDKNFFPHRKLISSAERKSPRHRRTPGKQTPIRKTPGKKTPAKTPKTKSGGSSKKKAMRRLLLDTESLSRSQPTRETLKRALFVSPEHRKPVPSTTSTSVPHQAMKSKRALFGSPENAETKSMDGTISDQFPKRKRDPFDDDDNGRSKIAKSLSFGGDSINRSQPVAFNRRASEVLPSKSSSELNETHKKKLLWAVSEALRVHGWRMSSPGFREKASALAQLTRRLLTLPPHAARLHAPKLSTSETMLKLARQYVYAIIQGRTIEECFQEEQTRLSNDSGKISGYISATAYQQMKARQAPATLTSQIKENTCSDKSYKHEQAKSATKNILQDKLVNIDTNSNSSSGISMFDKVGLYKSNSMPSFEEAAKMRARRQISFDSVDFPKR